MSKEYDIVVVGAGLVGATLALRLANSTSLRIALLERTLPLEPLEAGQANQRVVALGDAAVNLLRQVEVFEALSAQQAHPYQRMFVWDENSAGELCFNAQDIERQTLGYMVDAMACTHLLQAQALNFSGSRLDCFFDTQLQSLTLSEHGAQLETSHGSVSAQLVVGADGANSWVRQQAGIFANWRSYEQQGIVAKIRTSASHQDCAWQRFLSTGPVAALPVSDNFSSIVWSADKELASRLMQLNEAEFSHELSQAFEHRLGDVVELSPRQSFPLVSKQASTYFGPSVALVGDAAHSIHPLAGQGANLGFKDAAALSSLIAKAACAEAGYGKTNALGSVALLSHYERIRRADNAQTDWLMTALNSSYLVNTPAWVSARGLGMNWLNNSKRVKGMLARLAIGA